MALSDNIVVYWSLEDLVDSVGSNDLTNNNTATFVTGKVGNAVDLESGSNQYLSIASNTDLQTGDIDFAFSVWVKLESKATSMGIFAKSSGSGAGQTEYGLLYNITPDRFSMNFATATVSTLTNDANLGSPALDTWYHIVMWHDSVNNIVGMKINDGTATTASRTTGVYAHTNQFEVGRRNASASLDFDGLIDELIFRKGSIFSDAEITELYNGGAGRDAAYVLGAASSAVRQFMHYQKMRSA